MQYLYSKWCLLLFILLVISGLHPVHFSVINYAAWTYYYQGILSAAWLLMMMIQSVLGHKVYISQHRIVGKILLLLSILFIHAGIVNIHSVVNSINTVLQSYALEISFNHTLTLICFIALYFLGVKHHKNRALHTSCMVAISLLFITPIMSRVMNFWVPGLMLTSPEQYLVNIKITHGVTLSIAFFMAIKDHFRGEDPIPYLMTMIIIMTQFFSNHLVGEGALWAALVNAFAGTSIERVFIISFIFSCLPCLMSYWDSRKRA